MWARLSMTVQSSGRMEIEMVRRILPLVAGLLWAGSALAADISLLNVSYDPTRELYVDFNKAFAAAYQKDTGKSIEIKQEGRQFSPRQLTGIGGLGSFSTDPTKCPISGNECSAHLSERRFRSSGLFRVVHIRVRRSH